jgi:predicted nucleotidyltransferase
LLLSSGDLSRECVKDTDTFRLIQARLSALEAEHRVRVLMAVESGSRAWGFPSRDSDYDVRFIYIHARDWYLSLESRRDVFECFVDDTLDIAGWDIMKALRLFAKANPPLLEWLSSPIVYRDEEGFRSDLTHLLPVYYDPQTCRYHYIHMARNNYREYLTGPIVWIKKYLYVLRPLLAVKWIEQGGGPVPMEFSRLLGTIHDQEDVVGAIRALIERKRNGDELDREPAIPVIGRFIAEELEKLKPATTRKRADPPGLQLLQELFLRRLTAG